MKDDTRLNSKKTISDAPLKVPADHINKYSTQLIN